MDTIRDSVRLSQAELGQHGQEHGHTSSDITRDIRSTTGVTHLPITTFSSLISPRESNPQDRQDDGKQPRLGVPLTGNLLFTISWILCLCVPKAVYSYRGQSVMPTTLDWVGGITFTLM